MKEKKVKFIDLFAGLGGIRLGFESAFKALGYTTECVMTSEIKPYAIETLNRNFEHGKFVGDIFKVDNKSVPDFDFLLGGFPCQPFSASGKRHGFMDTRGTLFFEIERILQEKKPSGFILENVEGLVKHDIGDKNDEIGRTLETILYKLGEELGYKVTWKVFDSLGFGLAQSRKRIFIVGLKDTEVDLEGQPVTFKALNAFLEQGLETIDSDFTRKLLSHFELGDLYGKSIKDKRGGDNNIHSWDIGLKGEVSKDQSILLDKLFRQRRQKKWALEIGIDWMDGMPLTLKQVAGFSGHGQKETKEMLDDLVKKGYLRLEHPKKTGQIRCRKRFYHLKGI